MVEEEARTTARHDLHQDALERISLCLPDYDTGLIVHHGEDKFRSALVSHFPTPGNNAAEKLVRLKFALRDASNDDFWTVLMEGMTDLVGAQYGFVAKRILVNDENSAVEMPRIGEPGSCLMGLAFYYNDGHGKKDMFHNYRYLAYGAPCGHMRHDKVCIIPERMNEFITANPNSLPFPAEAYMGIPLFSEGKCFAHFGMMWSAEGAARRTLPWSHLEVLLHSLEDLILERILAGEGLPKPSLQVSDPTRPKVIPQEAISASQSLRPYARSLSHELRTPMQGVVGMLDVMHSTVQEVVEGESDSVVKDIFRTLRKNIEVVQDSSRRAVEAADNVVHAYDLNMQVPETPVDHLEDRDPLVDHRMLPANVSASNGLLLGNGSNRKRPRDLAGKSDPKITAKHRRLQPTKIALPEHTYTSGLDPVEHRSDTSAQVSPLADVAPGLGTSDHEAVATPRTTINRASSPTSRGTPLPIRQTTIRELVHGVVNESLRVGGRPDSAVAVLTDTGESIEVRTRNSRGESEVKMVEWSVQPTVPAVLHVDERDLTKLISCVFLNAIKFTDRGRIDLTAKLSPSGRFLLVTVSDTGSGIPEAFLPDLFKPFTQEDESLTRQQDGLGLGLLVAKGLARKMGGDLRCIRSDTSGPRQGSEFEIKVPVISADERSTASTPLGRTPSPSLERFPPARVTPARAGCPSPGPPNSFPAAMVPNGHASPEPKDLEYTSLPAPQLAEVELFAPSHRRNGSHHDSLSQPKHDRHLADNYPLTFLVAEDNKINRKLLVTMLTKLGYQDIHEAYDGAEAVRQMMRPRAKPIDVILMDLWMPNMDGHEAAERILAAIERDGWGGEGTMQGAPPRTVTILAVTADVTGTTSARAREAGMKGIMTKPFKLLDLERLIREYCPRAK